MIQSSMVFGSHMVLQCNKPVKVWGIGTPGRNVAGRLIGISEASCETQVEADGTWSLAFPPQEIQRNVVMEITDGESALTFTDVCVGEVWLAGGQSNMEYYLHFDADKDSVLKGRMNREIRFFDYPKATYEGALDDYDFHHYGFWRTCTKEDLPYFSAVAYYFADALQQSLDVPIGIVGCNMEGTLASAWADPKYLEGNEGEVWLREYEQAVKNLDFNRYRKNYLANPMNNRSDPLHAKESFLSRKLFPGLTRREQEGLVRLLEPGPDAGIPSFIGPYYQNRPGGLYETMLKKIAPLALRGVIWYQGESDDFRASIYSVVFRRLIKCWRDLWAEELPFLFVQLAPFGSWLTATGEHYPSLRHQQEIVAKSMHRVWMISSSDAGMEWDVHPKKKKPIGERLAFLAMGHVYGKEILCDPPEFLQAEREADGIRLRFANAEGLHIKGSELNALRLSDQNGEEVSAERVIVDGSSVVLVGQFPPMLTVSFAWTPYYEVNLYNREENPAKPFQTIVP